MTHCFREAAKTSVCRAAEALLAAEERAVPAYPPAEAPPCGKANSCRNKAIMF